MTSTAGGTLEASGPVPSSSPAWVRSPPTVGERRADALLAVALFCASILSMVLVRSAGGTGLGDPPAPWVSVLCLAVTLLPLAWRRRHPEAVTVGMATGFIVTTELGVPEVLILHVGFFVALYTLGAWSRRPRWARIVRWAVLAAMLIWLVSGFLRMDVLSGGGADIEEMAAGSAELAVMLYSILINILYFGGALWFGHHAWESARNRARLEEQAETLRLEQARVSAQAVVLERLRIARELHDAVAHHVSLMGVQSAAARATLTSDPQAAERSMRQVEESARRSVAELQQLLGTLRQEDQQISGGSAVDEASAGLGVAQIPQLVAEAQAHGTPVDWQIVGTPQELSALTSLNLYRIVQEALTNVRKHAGPGARADVRLRYGGAAVEVEISDDGAGRRAGGATGAAHPPAHPGGHGLAGMRERCAVGGGSLQAGPRSPHGFLIRAEIPYIQNRTSVRSSAGV